MTTKNNVYIISACRTPIGSFCGVFRNTKAHELGTCVIKETLKRAEINAEDLSEIILGQTLTSGQGQNPARLAALAAGVPVAVPAYGVNMLCGSGLKSVHLAYQAIKSGESSIVLAGGQENMSLGNHSILMRQDVRLGDCTLKDTILYDCLVDTTLNMHMGDTAEHLAQKYQVPRSEQDLYAYNSQHKTAAAIDNGYFKEEIVPIAVKLGKTQTTVVEDEYPRKNTTVEGLSKLRPVFAGGDERSVTAGNASGMNDGAAAVLLCSEEVKEAKNLKPMAKIVAFAQSGLIPVEMGLGPVQATKNVLKKANWSADDVDLFEINEAFAVQALLVVRQLNIPEEKVNVTGGAISLGHPVGCSGTRVLVTLLYNLKRLGKKRGIASLCVGGGMGIAIAVETC